MTRRRFLKLSLVAAAAAACDRGAEPPRASSRQPDPDLLPQLAGEAATAGGLLIENVGVFDGTRHAGTHDVLVGDGVIETVGSYAAGQGAPVRIDGTGRTLLPGLVDAHTHTRQASQLGLALLFGVTTELDMGSRPSDAFPLREGGRADMADVRSAGWMATSPTGHGSQFWDDLPTLTAAGEADPWVADRLDEGSDYIKLVLETLGDGPLDRAVVEALVDAAHARGVLALAHATRRSLARQAVEAGVDGLVHTVIDSAVGDELFRLAADQDTFLTTTISVFTPQAGAAVIADERLRPWLHPSTVEHLQLRPNFPLRDSFTRVGKDFAARWHGAQLPLLVGTDAPNPGVVHGASMHTELEMLVDAGLDPAAALAAATSTPAEVFGLHDRGRIEPGLRADLLLVNGDPTDDITATRDIAAIFKQGVLVDRVSLYDELDQLEGGD